MKEKLIQSFDMHRHMTTDINHAVASAIFDVVFAGNLEKWNAPQDKKWVTKYNKGALIIASYINATIKL